MFITFLMSPVRRVQRHCGYRHSMRFYYLNQSNVIPLYIVDSVCFRYRRNDHTNDTASESANER